MAPKPKLTPELAAEIRGLSEAGSSHIEIAAKLQIGRHLVAKGLAAAIPPDTSPSTLIMLDHDQLFPSPLNPRKTFEPESLSELAESICQRGILQNLVVRKAPNGKYEIGAGERRWRAVGELIRDFRWKGQLPCQLVQADDGLFRSISIIENLQRQDVPPMEEADAFVQLQASDPKTWTAQAIATAISRTPRYVYQRLALANKLAPATRAALAAGKINIEAARLLSTVGPEVQLDILDRSESDDGKIRVADIKEELHRTLIPVEHAIFDVAASGLEILELDEIQFFADRKAALAAQTEAVNAKAKELRKKWHFVKVLPIGEWPHLHQYLHGKTKAEGGGCVIQFETSGEVTIHEGLIKRPEPKSAPAPKLDEAAAKAAREKREAEQKAERLAAHQYLESIVTKLPTDLPDGFADFDGETRTDDDLRADGQPDCAAGCKWRGGLEYRLPASWLICLSPTGPRSGLLTFSHQAGSCFEPKTPK